jgi:membrane-bound metal-dependent hydrolase YbcI (DUF457 family)
MPQAGIHGLVGMVSRKWMPKREWLLLGLVLGNLFPDLDNIAVAVATLTKAPTEGLHRTFTHSIFTVIALVVLFAIIAALTRNPRWTWFGYGMAAGTLMHILLDLVLWFGGVEILWPIPFELNFWNWFTVPDWLGNLLLTGEFLAFGLFFVYLASLARRQNTDAGYQSRARVWAIIQFVLFGVFTILAFTMTSGYFTIHGALYLLSLFLAVGVTIRMRETIETIRIV